jgi:hypothetical protein
VLFSRGRLVREGAAREVEEGVVEFRGRRYVRLRAGRASVFELLDG